MVRCERGQRRRIVDEKRVDVIFDADEVQLARVPDVQIVAPSAGIVIPSGLCSVGCT